MGMYDNVNFECVCPVCHSKVDGFQSKDGECALDDIRPQDVGNFYAPCYKCGCWIEFYHQKNGSYLRTVLGRGRRRMRQYDKLIFL